MMDFDYDFVERCWQLVVNIVEQVFSFIKREIPGNESF